MSILHFKDAFLVINIRKKNVDKSIFYSSIRKVVPSPTTDDFTNILP